MAVGGSGTMDTADVLLSDFNTPTEKNQTIYTVWIRCCAYKANSSQVNLNLFYLKC